MSSLGTLDSTDRLASGRPADGTPPAEPTLGLLALQDGAAPKTADLSARYGVKVQELNGQYQFSYRADGKDHSLLSTAASNDGLKQAQIQLQSISEARMASIARQYKVEFAREGEDAMATQHYDNECTVQDGEMAHALLPTLPQLDAVEEGLKRSRPSQLTDDGKQGIKIYFTDKQTLPANFTQATVLAAFREHDNHQHRALFIMPSGAALAPTEKDEGALPTRNLKWGIMHEITHNSQTNFFSDGKMPDWISGGMGWNKDSFLVPDEKILDFYSLTDKSGHMWKFGADDCKMRPTWYRTDTDGFALKPDGSRTNNISEANQAIGADLQYQLPKKPATGYFTRPEEMLSEALTSYRSGRENRAQLLKTSPDIYAIAQKYDQQEIAKFYGVDSHGQPKYVRTPEGLIVQRETATVRSISEFEKSHRR